MNSVWLTGTGADMNIKNMEAYLKESSNLKDLDPNLWERLIWQEALDKAIHKKKDRRIGPNTSSVPTQDQKTK